jgi:rare lipoprotein A
MTAHITKFIKASIVILFMLLLAGCAFTRHKDGPPNYYVDVSKIPNATPKVEPRARYGNLPSYTVFGKRYYTLKSSKGYQAIGTASWYGTQFHSLRTSSGERYNMLGMTAAHKTLPLPTYVQVTNLKNHRQVIVKVNDRGPFASNRIIDLSYVAAKKLGMLGHGTATVEVKAIDPLTYHHPLLMASSKPSKSSRRTRSWKEA